MIREATAADAAEIARVQVASWEAVYRGLMPDGVIDSFTVERRTDQWEYFFSSSAGRTALVAEHDGVVVGMASIGPARNSDVDPAAVGEVYAIYVSPDHWDHGHGYALVVEAVVRLAYAGHTEAILWVLTTNERARHFYEQAGWSLDGHTRVEVFPEGSLAEVRYRRSLA